MGELLADLPSEVRVHISGLALGLSTYGALLQHWLRLALVGQDLCQNLQSILCHTLNLFN